MSDLDNFKAWYVDVLAALYPKRSAGIAVFMLSLPLAERYLRQKNNLRPDVSLDDTFMGGLCAIFPVLRDAPTARRFWPSTETDSYIRQRSQPVLLKERTLPVGWLTHDTADAIQIRPDRSFCGHPVLFSEAIVREIEKDFAVFAGVAAGAPALGAEARLDPVTIPNTYIGNRSGP